MRPERRKTDTAIAGNYSRDTLADLGLHERVGKQQPIVMGMHIDEPGSHHKAANLHHLVSTEMVQIADGENHAVAHRNIRLLSGLPRAVNHDPATQQ